MSSQRAEPFPVYAAHSWFELLSNCEAALIEVFQIPIGDRFAELLEQTSSRGARRHVEDAERDPQRGLPVPGDEGGSGEVFAIAGADGAFNKKRGVSLVLLDGKAFSPTSRLALTDEYICNRRGAEAVCRLSRTRGRR